MNVASIPVHCPSCGRQVAIPVTIESVELTRSGTSYVGPRGLVVKPGELFAQHDCDIDSATGRRRTELTGM